MTNEQKDLTQDHIHHASQANLEVGMKYLSRVFKHLAEWHDEAEMKEIQEIIDLDMDEIFWRKVGRK